MKRKLKMILLPVLMLLAVMMTESVQAQKYTVAVGWRAGGTNGISLKLVPVKGIALEGIYGIYPYGESITGMLESHSPIFCIRALQVYVGAGAHYRFNYRSGIFSDPVNGTIAVNPPPGTKGWGLDAVAGIELKLPFLPLALSAELKPMIEWTDAGGRLMGMDPGLGVKIVF